MNKLNRLKKLVNGGTIRKFDGGGELYDYNLGPEGEAALARIQNRQDIGRGLGAAAANAFGLNGVKAEGHQYMDANGNVRGLSAQQESALGYGAQIGVKAVEAIDDALMGDKNFGAQSAAIDSAVHGVSGALMKSGNPYAMAAGAALEGANFLTKAGGQTVEGFDVDINNAGYGNLGHMESSSSRDFGAMIGLGGLNTKSMERKLAQRNEQAQMALTAAAISNDTSYEQEARSNAKENVLRQNQVALAGGIDSSLLAN